MSVGFIAPEPVAPLLKWPGGKRKLAPRIVDLLRSKTSEPTRYVEPFLGSAAVYLHAAAFLPATADVHLGDASLHLAVLYRVLRDWPEDLITELRRLPTEGIDYDVYRRERATFNAAFGDVVFSLTRTAARMIWLNRACFNGLWRTNGSGHLDVAWGKRTKLTSLPTDAHIRAASHAVRAVRFLHPNVDFLPKLLSPTPLTQPSTDLTRTWVYFDPPYLPLHNAKTTFTRYSSPFGEAEHVKLAAVGVELARAGATVVASGADCPALRRIYGDAWNVVDRFNVARTVSRDGDGRKPVAEVLMMPRV